MKKSLTSTIVWLALIVILSEITTLVFNDIYLPFVNPQSPSYDEGPIPYLILLSIYIILFSSAGVIMAWKIKEIEKAIILSMSIGVFWTAIEATIHVPVFFLMPNHPLMHDYFFTFIGALTPPLFCALGSYIYCKYTIKKPMVSQHNEKQT